MRSLLLALLFSCAALDSRGETVREWVEAAPKANLTFTRWDGDTPTADDNRADAIRLPQGFYGYLDLSQLPPESFPVKLRLIYDTPFSDDLNSSQPGHLNQLKDSAPADPGSVVIEYDYAAPSDAQAVPVWNTPLPLRHSLNYNDQMESVRAEVQSRSGALLGRRLIGVTSPTRLRPRAVLINAPGANEVFAQYSYRSVGEARRLVPDGITYLTVDTIWIDAATAADPQLSDAFWQQVLLAGTTVAGHPDDIALLTKRLGLAANEPVLLGRFVSNQSPEEFGSQQGSVNITNVSVEHIGGINAFAFTEIVGREMHSQLLGFSEFYLGVFVFLQAAVIVVGFLRLRGAVRVWLWLIVPCFALAYTVAGIALAHVLVQSRSEGRLAQVELQVEGWPKALLFTHLEQISLGDRETVLDLPPDSFPFNPRSSDNYGGMPNATFSFHRAADASELTTHAHPGTRFSADTRSIIAAKPPCDLDAKGMLTVSRPFSGAWLWDGATWRELGPLYAGQKVDVNSTRMIHPSTGFKGRFISTGDDEEDFPSLLKPLLDSDTLDAFSFSRQNLFLGVEPVDDVMLENSSRDQVESRRVIAYQFHSSGGTP